MTSSVEYLRVRPNGIRLEAMVLFEEKGDDYTLASSCPHLGKAAKDFFEDTQT